MALTLCSAGAGSGKTFRLCEVIAQRVLGGLDPARILATTFTRKAAAELRNRVEARLLQAEGLPAARRTELVQRLDLAAMGTVHSVAQRLIALHALELGLSPDVEVLDEKAQKHHLQHMMAEVHGADSTELDDLMTAFSVKEPDKLLLDLLEKKRTNGLSDADFLPGLRDDLEPWIRQLAQGAPIARPNALARLQDLGRQALDELKACVERKNQAGTRKAAERLAQALHARQPTWASFAVAEIFAAGNRDGGQDAVAPLADALRESLRWTGLHDDLRRLVALTGARVCRLGEAWDAYKQARGLFDFADLEVWLLRLLQDERLAGRVAGRFDLVVVDEFQDTNPIQLAIFLRLERLVRDSWWVGDDKQAIYGFRGADANLVRTVWTGSPAAKREHLPRSHRSQAGIVRFVNQVFAGPLPGCALEPTRPAASAGLERWSLGGSNVEKAMASLAVGIRQLLEDGAYAPGQIAVLARTNDGAAAAGQALREAGVARKLALPGLLGAREVAVTVAALRLLIEPRDTLAAATVVHLLRAADEAASSWLQARLTRLAEDPCASWDELCLEPLRALADANLAPTGAVRAVIAALDLSRRVAAWGEPVARLARLDALSDLAGDYEARAIRNGTGATLAGFVLDLDHLEAAGEDKEPIATDADAVLVSTVHAAKGLEWPVVVLIELDKTYDPSIGDPVVHGGDIAGGRPLSGRRVRWWPDPFGSRLGTDLLFLQSAAGQVARQAQDDGHLRLLYVAMTRARDKLIFAIRGNMGLEAGRGALACLPAWARLIPDTLAPGLHEMAELGTSLHVRNLEPPEEQTRPAYAATTGWWLPVTHERPAAVQRTWSPSSEKHVDLPGVRTAVDALAGPAPFRGLRAGGVRVEDRADWGNALHAYLATLPATAAIDRAGRITIAEDCLRGHGAEQGAAPEDFVAAGERFVAWCEQRYPGAVLHAEVAVTGPRADGGSWHGSIDALLELPSGEVVVVDHKSAVVHAPAGQEAVARQHAGQLRAYREALAGLGLRVESTWLHLPVGGACLKVAT